MYEMTIFIHYVLNTVAYVLLTSELPRLRSQVPPENVISLYCTAVVLVDLETPIRDKSIPHFSKKNRSFTNLLGVNEVNDLFLKNEV